jgi:crotonobetainyl-CoA:carnitine CoA-transferase CaiB-like acyl-CoA transferase
VNGYLEASELGPLDGVRVIEIASLAPAPFGCMILSDLGADVLRVERAESCGPDAAVPVDPLSRGRRSIGLNLKDPAGIEALLRLAERADVLVEGFRPGVTERLGCGPADCAERNPRLVYARMTGWGQDGPLAATAGHDIDYIGVSGALDPIGRAGQRPVPPLNLVADFGGGGMLLALGILAALVERARSGLGQVIDAAMVDGSALLTSFLYGLRAAGAWQDERGTNLLDGGAPFYDTYETADGRYVAVGALEPKFYAALLTGLGLAPAGPAAGLPGQYDRAGWPVLRARFTEAFLGRTRAEWAEVFAGTDACVAPVLGPAEAPAHPHNVARGTFVDVGGVVQPAPAPRFGRTAAGPPRPPGRPGADTDAVLAGLGYTAAQIAALRASGAAG